MPTRAPSPLSGFPHDSANGPLPWLSRELSSTSAAAAAHARARLFRLAHARRMAGDCGAHGAARAGSSACSVPARRSRLSIIWRRLKVRCEERSRAARVTGATLPPPPRHLHRFSSRRPRSCHSGRADFSRRAASRPTLPPPPRRRRFGRSAKVPAKTAPKGTMVLKLIDVVQQTPMRRRCARSASGANITPRPASFSASRFCSTAGRKPAAIRSALLRPVPDTSRSRRSARRTAASGVPQRKRRDGLTVEAAGPTVSFVSTRSVIAASFLSPPAAA